MSCMDQYILSYLVSFHNSKGIYLFLNTNETEVVLDSQDGLDDNQKYVYTVTTINSVGNATSQNRSFCELITL